MLGAKDIYQLYDKAKHLLQAEHLTVNPYREINYGLQFLIFKDNLSGFIRIYDGKKGLRFDFSQLKDDDFSLYVQAILSEKPKKETLSDLITSKEKDVEKLNFNDKDPDDLIGIDESGKGDYFGPLVIAAVRVTPDLKPELEALGVTDSKKLSATSISFLAKQIKKRCQHTILVMGNQSYNEVYEKYSNLNHILAWAHMKVLEDTLKQGDCKHALSDQFGNASLLKNSLRAKDLKVTLFQRPRAESNVAVACASIIARYHFVTELEKMSKHYNMTFPKGSTNKAVDAAIDFVNTIGKDKLFSVAKLHFNVTQKIEQSLS